MRKICIALIVASLLTAGCSKPEDKYVGTYTGRVEMTDEMKKMMEGFASMGGDANFDFDAEMQKSAFGLELRDDGTYTALDNKNSNDEGTWRLDEEAGLIYISKPADFNEGVDKGMGANPMAGMAAMGDSLKDLNEIKLIISEDGTVLSFSMMEMLKEAGSFDAPQGMDLSAFDMKFFFTRQ